MEILADLGLFVAGLLAGGFGMRWHIKRPQPFTPVDRIEGVRRYQEFKNG